MYIREHLTLQEHTYIHIPPCMPTHMHMYMYLNRVFILCCKCMSIHAVCCSECLSMNASCYFGMYWIRAVGSIWPLCEHRAAHCLLGDVIVSLSTLSPLMSVHVMFYQHTAHLNASQWNLPLYSISSFLHSTNYSAHQQWAFLDSSSHSSSHSSSKQYHY